MKITRNGTVLDLKIDSEVPITLSNPMFNETGSYTYPFSTPATPSILAALGFPDRPDRAARYANKAAATLEHGLLRLSGTHNISAIDPDAGEITNDFIADEGAFYEEIADRMLSEIIIGRYAPPPEWTGDKFGWLISHLDTIPRDSLAIPLAYDFTWFPVCIDVQAIDGGNEYIVLNKPDVNGMLLFGVSASGSIDPTGISPFLFVRTILAEVFRRYNLTPLTNPFVSHPELIYAVVLNNTADALTPGYIDYADLVPNITVSSFITAIENRFGCKFFIDFNLHTVDIRLLSDIMAATPAADFTDKLSAPVALTFPAQQKLVITTERSFPRAVTVGDSESDLFSSLSPKTINSVYDDPWLIVNSADDKPTLYNPKKFNYYKATDELRTDPLLARHFVLLSSDFFDYSARGNYEQFKVECADESVPNIQVYDSAAAAPKPTYIDIPQFAAGQRRLHATPIQGFETEADGSENRDCPLAFTLFRGIVRATYPELVGIPTSIVVYPFACSHTSHPIENPGITLAIEWLYGDPIPRNITLTPSGIRDAFYRLYEQFVNLSNIPATAGISFSALDINNIRWYQKITLKGQPYFIDKINLTLIGNDRIRVDSVDIRTARNFGIPETDIYVFEAIPQVIDVAAANPDLPTGYYILPVTVISTINGAPVPYREIKSETWAAASIIFETLAVIIQPNTTGAPRTGTIILRQTESIAPDIIITVNQAG